jgi:hypothetical protein
MQSNTTEQQPATGTGLNEPYISIQGATFLLGECWEDIQARLPVQPEPYLIPAADTEILPLRLLREAYPHHSIWQQFGVNAPVPRHMRQYISHPEQMGTMNAAEAALMGFMLQYGAVPEPVVMGHKCGEGTCVNPVHLFIDVPIRRNERGDALVIVPPP